MCGICGFNWLDPQLVSVMADTMRHRGPDQSGQYVDEGVSLGHRRLSVIDLSEKARQPMSNEDGSLWMVFNGEIYNYPELRQWLVGRGHVFHSKADSEVVLHAYEELGFECLSRLNGMFAFAIWDKGQQTLFLARDRLGEKPLYFSFDGNRFVFASEIKALLKVPAIATEVDELALHYYLGFEFVPAPLTMFKGIEKIPAGHYLVLRKGELRKVRYWDLPKIKTAAGSVNNWIADLRDQLERAVRIRLHSDVPLGVFLSGGIDSSSVVAMMRRITTGPIHTFSLGYQESSFSELPFAKRVSEQFETTHTELTIDPITPDVIERAIWHLDEPMSEFSVLPYYLICQKAREHVTVCLGGEGGDEVFAGYDRFKASKAAQLCEHVPHWLWETIHSAAMLLPDRPQKKGLTNSLKRFVEGSSLPRHGGHMRWQYFLSPRHAAGLYRNGFGDRVKSESLQLIEQVAEQCTSPDRLDRELYVELKFVLPENPLMKVDKMSMAHSLEVRAPLLDHELVEYAAQIPSQLKLKGWTTKSIFKNAMTDLLPAQIVRRPKQGYSFPIKHWLRGELGDYMEEVLQESPFIRDNFNRDYIETLISEHRSERHNHNHILWALMNLGLWHTMYFR